MISEEEMIAKSSGGTLAIHANILYLCNIYAAFCTEW